MDSTREFGIIARANASPLLQRWAQIEAAAGTQTRLAEIAQDTLRVTHFESRTATLFGKAMTEVTLVIVCTSRRICVGLYDEIVKLRPDWKDAAVDI